ncbi:Fc receptor-like protein 5 isoform X2 [Larimichthys crocea]|uniref:Fc receptor-like protein 5 isoform X2 n=1 Tax=Larimichthys crocea TaxID=215358 RepID=UPI000F5E9982|nr:Fc receptor-like protein 5 isoform X2 [Larimichthys crocea]
MCVKYVLTHTAGKKTAEAKKRETGSRLIRSEEQSDVSVLDVKMGHTLLRVLELFLVNTLLYVHAEVGHPKPRLTVDTNIIHGKNNVTLTCSVEGSADWTVWKYDWFKRTSYSSEAQSIRNGVPENIIGVSEEGLYNCRGRREDPPFYTEYSNEVTIQKIFSNRVSLTLQPNWTQIFKGETITLRCQIEGGGGTDWTYQWTPERLNIPPTNNEYRISSATESDSGEYRCIGRRDSYSSTGWSNTITLTVSARKPEPRLTADNIPVRGTVRLTCSVEGSADWKYDWFKRTSDSSKAQSIRNGVPHKVIEVSEGGLYHCRGGRGDPPFYTEESNEVTVHGTVSNRVSLTLQPNRTQIFRGETITLRCQIEGGGGTDWAYIWIKDKLNIPSTNNEYRISSATESDSGKYWCKGRRDSYSSTEWSNFITLTVSPNRPKAELSADDRDIPVGGSVTLTCSVKTSSSGWKYFWYRGEKTSEPLTTQDVLLSTGRIRVSQEGVYWCRGGRGEPVYYTEYSDSISINKIVVNKAVVTLQPNWSEIFSGETITLRCEIKNGGDTEWEYEWKTTSSRKPSNQNEVSITSAYVSHSGDYRCKGRKKNKQSTDWSDPIKLTVSDEKPKSVLTVSPLWLNAGDSVTLNCEVEHPSAGWRFYWYKTVPKLPDYSYSLELLPVSSNGTEQDSYIVHGQTGTARYVCRAERGDPVYYTQYSEPKFVWSRDFHSSASLTVSPDRVQHFTSDSVSLNCEGNSTEWRVRGLTGNRYLSYCSYWGTMTGSTCNMYSSWQSDGVFWCESGSGEFSNAVNISLQDINIILVSPVHPVTEGDPVSLSCKLRTGIFDSNVFFYRNDELIQNDTRKERNISAVSKSDEGFYKCQYSEEESPQSWMSVKAVSRPESSSFPVGLIVGLVCGTILLLLILLFLLYCYRSSKDSRCISQSERTIQGSDTNQVLNQNEAQGAVYSTLLHGGSQDVTYSLIELKNIKKKGKQHGPEESTVYSDVKTRTADDNLMYAQVNHHNKGKAKKTKGIPHPAPTEAVYSEVKPGTSLGL